MTNIKSKISLPFKIIKSEVSGGFIDKVHNEFTGGIDIVNMHEDVLNNYFEANLQSPFTNQWVGGKSHRHVPINDGNDRSENRPEAWHLEFRNTEPIMIRENFSSYSTNDTTIAGFIGDGASSVRTRVADDPGKKYFVLRGNPVGGGRFLQTENMGEISQITYTFIVYVLNGTTYDYDFQDPNYGLALEDPDAGEDLVLDYSYDGNSWTTKKTIFLGSIQTIPYLREITETVDLSAEKPAYIRFRQTNWSGDAGNEGDNYGITDIIITTKQITSNPKISFYSHAYRNSPPAYWTREEYSKRPLNIKNIKSSGSLLAGNFTENYQVLQTSGRRITNNLIVDGFEADDVLTTQFITGSNNYRLPELNKVSGSRSVIVERFNAPGSKEESSRGALDREGEEMSPNIPLPYRNIKIRQPFYRQLAQHNPQFGSGSTYKLLPETGIIDTVTIHKVNRNRLVRGEMEQFDNGFVVHAIPRTDIQYSWITASAITTAAELGGYQSFKNIDSPGSYYNFRHAYEDIDFVKESHFGFIEEYLIDENSLPILLDDGGYIIIGFTNFTLDNLYINSLIKENKTIDLDCRTFNTKITDIVPRMSELTNSPYTFTSWTSIRGGYHPIARKLKKNNYISTLQECENYIDPVVTFKYRPLEHDLKAFGQEDVEYNIKHTYTNNLSSVANKELIEKLYLEQEDSEQFYDELYSIYTEGVSGSPITDFVSYKYKEIIWPKEENTSLARTRKRNAYYLDMPGTSRDGYDRQLGTQRSFWRDLQEERKRSKNSLGGYYSSIDYNSTQETGSNFGDFYSQIPEVYETEQGTRIEYWHQFATSSGQDNGLYNSISIHDNSIDEEYVYNYMFDSYMSGGLDEQVAFWGKRANKFKLSGEFNHNFIHMYGMSLYTGSLGKQDIGSIYVNTYYKSLHTSELENPEQNIKNDNDEVLLNPKVRYTAFVGGVELNTGSVITTLFTPNDGVVIKENGQDLFGKDLSADDVLYSTLDFGLQRETEQINGRKPFFDSYEEYLEDIRAIGKDLSTIPEFKISDHIKYYHINGFRAENKKIFYLDGQKEYQSADSETSTNNINFYKNYLQSDLLKRHDKVKNENRENSQIKSIKIKVSGIKKLLPYNGFYPRERSIQLANLYAEYAEENLRGGIYSLSHEDYGDKQAIFQHMDCNNNPYVVDPGKEIQNCIPIQNETTTYTYGFESGTYDQTGTFGTPETLSVVEGTTNIYIPEITSLGGGDDILYEKITYNDIDGEEQTIYRLSTDEYSIPISSLPKNSDVSIDILISRQGCEFTKQVIINIPEECATVYGEYRISDQDPPSAPMTIPFASEESVNSFDSGQYDQIGADIINIDAGTPIDFMLLQDTYGNYTNVSNPSGFSLKSVSSTRSDEVEETIDSSVISNNSFQYTPQSIWTKLTLIFNDSFSIDESSQPTDPTCTIEKNILIRKITRTG